MADEQNRNPPQQSMPANAQDIIARQQAELQKQIEAARARDRVTFGPAAENAAPPAPVMGGVFNRAAQRQGQPTQQQQQQQPQGFNLPQGMSAQRVAQGISQQPPPQGLAGIPHPSVVQHGGMAPVDLSRLPDPAVPQVGVTVASLAQGAQIQGGHVQGGMPQFYPQQQAPVQQQSENKSIIRWYPGRNSQINIELEDSIICGVPDEPEQEPDPQAKVVAALLLEVLSLRERVQVLEQGMGASPNDLERRVYVLEMTLFEQRAALTQGARALREEAERQALLEEQERRRQADESGGNDPSE